MVILTHFSFQSGHNQVTNQNSVEKCQNGVEKCQNSVEKCLKCLNFTEMSKILRNLELDMILSEIKHGISVFLSLFHDF